MLKRIVVWVMLITLAQRVVADDTVSVASQPHNLSGNLSIVGSGTLATLMMQWGRLFSHHFPAINMQIHTSGSSTAIPALIEGTTNFGSMSREISGRERGLFEQRYGYPPTAIKVAIDAMAIYVHQDNPLASLRLTQLDALYSQTLYCGATTPIKKWGQLGLSGSWKTRNVQLIGRNSASGTYGLFKEKALCEGDFRAEVNGLPSSASVLRAVSVSLNAIGYAGLSYRTAGVKLLPLEVDGISVFATPESIISGHYPLSRYLYVYVNKPQNKPLLPKEAEFIKLMLSTSGQMRVATEGFMPLPATMIDSQLEKLGL